MHENDYFISGDRLKTKISLFFKNFFKTNYIFFKNNITYLVTLHLKILK